ncbi:MAG: sulfatase-like hydrolase/transferase, partial [Cellulomonas sp.]|nr:sulfatase-like hydrolase/transferase [Cellulomonas sp.]
STVGVRIGECGFDPYERDDGIHPYSGHDPDPAYNDYLRRNGCGGDNPWEAWANTGTDSDGQARSGWFLKYSRLPARVPEQHSETPYMTRRAMDFMREAGDQPWCLHLSYIKPHWPYIVPEPYASMYGPQDVPPVVRSEAERRDPHPVYAAMMKHRVSRTFSQDGVREAVIPAYMGLIKQIDDQMGVLFSFMEEAGLMDSTMIVFTSDHGDYLGDHWMGEKDLFHEPVIRVPLIVYDPDARADATRGTRCADLVEAVDLAPTFLDVCGGAPVPHVMDGRSLRPLLFGQRPADWRREVVCEYDYAFQDARIELGTAPRDAWMRMIFDGRWKYVVFEGYRPMLFDLASDPDEFVDLGASQAPEHEQARQHLHEALFPEQTAVPWFWTVPGPANPPDRVLWDRAVARFRELSEHARAVGVQLSIEVYEGTFLGDADSAVAFITDIDRDNVGLNPDLGNLVRAQRPIEPWEAIAVKLLPLANYWHVKNYVRIESPLEDVFYSAPATLPVGLIDYRKAVRYAIAQGFRGAFLAEHYGGDGLGVSAENARYLRGLIADALEDQS